jgi:hypothetical protein
MTHDILKIIQHADDCILPLKDKQSLKYSIEVMENFSKVSGMKLNMSKTQLFQQVLGKIRMNK